MPRIIITAPSYNPAIGGAITLHKLCHILNLIGYDAYLYPTLKLNDQLKYFTLNEQYNTKIATELNLEKEYYYIPLNDFVSIKHNDGKAIILKGFTEKEINSIKFVDDRSGQDFFNKPNEIKKHTNQKFYILEKRENEKDNG
jgi:hypothetical protein